MSPSQPTITDRTNPPLLFDARAVLNTMFSGYREVIAKSELQGGLSGSRVLLVRPVKADGAELPTVVKIDRADLIQREWQAYQAHIHNRLPGVAEIRGEPVCSSEGHRSGLCYPLIGAGIFDVESLYQYCQHANIEDIRHVLESRLLKSLRTFWSQTHEVQADLHLQTYYDSFLPVNLVIEYAEPPSDMQPQELHPNNITTHTCNVGDYVQLSGFRVANIAHQAQRLSLDMPSDTRAAYRVHIAPIPGSKRYKLDTIIHEPFTGIVRKTRYDLLQEQVKTALGPFVDITKETIALANNITLPNPLNALPYILNQTFDAYTAYIHGDLNLQNVLVEPENRNTYLIDFAKSRRDHVLRDLLHLEMAVVTELLPKALAETMRAPTAVIPFYEQLHNNMQHLASAQPPVGLEKPFAILQTIRRAAQHHLFTPDNWAEYLYGLAIYLLGALRYPSLDKVPGAKATAFCGAAATLKLLATPSADPPEPPGKERGSHSQGTRNEDTMGARGNQTNFYGSVLGPIHTGSGDINVSSNHSANRVNYQDLFSTYEIGVGYLLAQMGNGHSRYSDALVYQQRLQENVSRVRRFGDTPTRQADRAEVLDQLNELVLAVLGKSFNELCVEVK